MVEHETCVMEDARLQVNVLGMCDNALALVVLSCVSSKTHESLTRRHETCLIDTYAGTRRDQVAALRRQDRHY